MENLKCPKCNGQHWTIGKLLSYPAQYEFYCICGFKLKYKDREDSFKFITQEELDKYKD